MPVKNRIQLRYSVEDDHAKWLKQVAERYDLENESKALRVLLDFAIRDVDPDLVFHIENMRCRHC